MKIKLVRRHLGFPFFSYLCGEKEGHRDACDKGEVSTGCRRGAGAKCISSGTEYPSGSGYGNVWDL